MKYNLQKTNQVSVCYKQSCIHAYGKNADKIATAVGVMLLFVGIAALVKAAN